jgi:hypothetical protein
MGGRDVFFTPKQSVIFLDELIRVSVISSDAMWEPYGWERAHQKLGSIV